MTTPRLDATVTVSIVTFQGVEWIAACLRSVLAQSHAGIEIIVLDNGSTDGTVDVARACLAGRPSANVIELGANLGYAAAHNRAIDRATGETICLLNQDAVLDSRFIATAVAALAADARIGAVQGLILSLGPGFEQRDVIDTTGLTVGRDRRFSSRRQGQPVGRVDAPKGEVFGADGPAPVLRAEALRSVQIRGRSGRLETLDEDFFLYHEDTDLAWRLRLAGWTAVYEPMAMAWHARGMAGPLADDLRTLARRRRRADPSKSVPAWRNLRLMLIKNELAGSFRRDFVAIARREFGSFVLLVVLGPRRIDTLVGFLRLVPSALRKRRQVQRLRVVSDRDLRLWFEQSRRRNPGTTRPA